MNVARRKFVTLIGSSIAAGPLNALAQQRVGTRRIAMLILGNERDPIPRTWVAAFQGGSDRLVGRITITCASTFALRQTEQHSLVC
jgi:hypothetical protein